MKKWGMTGNRYKVLFFFEMVNVLELDGYITSCIYKKNAEL